VTQRHRSTPREEADCLAVDISLGGDHAVELGTRPPWLVDMDLPMAGEEDAAAAAETECRLLLYHSKC